MVKTFKQWFLGFYFNSILKSHFKKIRVISNIDIDNRSILLVSNHFSWWDAFIAQYISRVFNKKFYLLIQESEMNNRQYLSNIGAFPITKTSRGLYNSLIYAANLLKEENNMVTIFPQGKTFSQHHIALEFTKEIERILQDKPNCRVIMAVNLVDYYSFKKPSLSIYLNEYIYEGSFDLTQFQFAYNMFLKQSIHQQDKNFKQ